MKSRGSSDFDDVTPVGQPSAWPTEADLAADERTAYEAIAHKRNLERQSYLQKVEDAVKGWGMEQGIEPGTSAERGKVVDRNKFYKAVGALNEKVLGWPLAFLCSALQEEKTPEIVFAAFRSEDPNTKYLVKIRILNFIHPDKEEKQGLDFIVVVNKTNLRK